MRRLVIMVAALAAGLLLPAGAANATVSASALTPQHATAQTERAQWPWDDNGNNGNNGNNNGNCNCNWDDWDEWDDDDGLNLDLDLGDVL